MQLPVHGLVTASCEPGPGAFWWLGGSGPHQAPGWRLSQTACEQSFGKSSSRSNSEVLLPTTRPLFGIKSLLARAVLGGDPNPPAPTARLISAWANSPGTVAKHTGRAASPASSPRKNTIHGRKPVSVPSESRRGRFGGLIWPGPGPLAQAGLNRAFGPGPQTLSPALAAFAWAKGRHMRAATSRDWIEENLFNRSKAILLLVNLPATR